MGARAGTELLGIDFAPAAVGWTVAGASPMPELAGGGAPLIDAIVAVLRA